MVAIIDEKRVLLHELCKAHHVKRLELFGSAATGIFQSDESDFDFAVEFKPLAPSEQAAAYFDLLASLQDLFARDIDLIEISAITNPFFLRSFESQRQVVYAA
jgi:uncharacterized protein